VTVCAGFATPIPTRDGVTRSWQLRALPGRRRRRGHAEAATRAGWKAREDGLGTPGRSRRPGRASDAVEKRSAPVGPYRRAEGGGEGGQAPAQPAPLDAEY
jgi:hypothetical protein